MVCSLHVSTKTGPTAILRCFMQPYSLTDLLLKKQRFLDTSVERLWNRTQTEDITLFPEGLTRIICGITWGRGKHGVNSDGTSCQSCHCQFEILRQSNDTQQRHVGKLKDRITPHVTNFFRLRLTIEKQEGKRKYKSDGAVMVSEFVCMYVCSCTVSE